ncbi:MAG: winged helix DNA-binding domain-containing protein [Acidimicrobiia bacterium]
MDRITQRALNRTTLGRQLLLERSERPIAGTIEHLVGMQGQNPHDPYYGLWSRLQGFDPDLLSGMIERREAVRGSLLRGTIHLATTTDFVALRSQLQPTLAAVLGSTSFARDTREVDWEELLELGRSLIEKEPMTRAALAGPLEERWPGVPGPSLAMVVTYLLPVVQAAPRGLWGRSGPAAWTTIESWAGLEIPMETSVEETVWRYLTAFGPASIPDMRVWSRLPDLRRVVDGMRPRLRVFESEDGAELLDIPDAPILEEDTPAPPRFLPEYDNVLLGHQDRSRFFLPGVIPQGWVGNLLVDGLFSGSWKIHRSKGQARLDVSLLRKISPADVTAVEEEAECLLQFADPDAGQRELVIADDR